MRGSPQPYRHRPSETGVQAHTAALAIAPVLAYRRAFVPQKAQAIPITVALAPRWTTRLSPGNWEAMPGNLSVVQKAILKLDALAPIGEASRQNHLAHGAVATCKVRSPLDDDPILVEQWRPG